jgi:hypothetical protein
MRQAIRFGLVAAVLAMLAVACGGVPPAPYHIMPSALVPITPAHNRARAFGRLFCGTLKHFVDPNGNPWGDCGRYLENVDTPPPKPEEFSLSMPVLFVAGFGDECMKDVRAFGPSIAHLKDEHAIDVETFRSAPYASSAETGRAIARRIDESWKADPMHRRLILVGYSKGAVDLLEALDLLDEAPTKVSALITIAGMVSGTPEARAFRELFAPVRPWIDPRCPSNIGNAVDGLLPDVRLRFPKHSSPLVPTYAVVGVTSLEATSKVFHDSWKRLSRYAAEQDGILPAWHGVLDGATFLGVVRADHWAIALPFHEAGSHDKAIDRNRFPRDALFEALLRFVSADVVKSDRAAAPVEPAAPRAGQDKK